MKTNTHFDHISLSSCLNEKCFRQKSKHTFLVQYFLFRKSCRLWDNVEKYGTARQGTDDIIWRMRIACWIPKTTNTLSEYVIFIAFLLQQLLHERA